MGLSTRGSPSPVLLLLQPLLLLLLLLLPSLVFTSSRNNCSSSEFSCAVDGRCIPLQKWQDGIDDCFDGSDEVCLPWQFDCRFGRPRCISARKVHDGHIDCFSALDEGCPSHFFVCLDRSACIEPRLFQDGNPDCGDSSDEPCLAGEFPCADRATCLSSDLFQNGNPDCTDGSDEECTATQFECLCGKKRCVEASRVRDGKADCDDASDEEPTSSLSKFLLEEVASADTAHRVCPNGERARHGRYSNLNSSLVLCDRPHDCHESLGEVCIVAGGTWRCVCKLGTIRPVGSARCLPVELMGQYMDNPVGNCSDLQEDLALHFHSQPTTEEVSTRRRTEQKTTNTPTTTKTSSTRTATAMRSSSTRSTPTKKAKKTTTAHIDYSEDEGGETLSMGNRSESFFLCERNVSDSCKGDKEVCVLTPEGGSRCDCPPGWTRGDRGCQELVDECSNSTLNDCHSDALCLDNPLGYECLCQEGFLDTSPHPRQKPGRSCRPLIDECSTGKNDCDPVAQCLDKVVGFACRCPSSHVDVSPEGPRLPGRRCSPRVDECMNGTAHCDPNADCEDLADGYRCSCRRGFSDVSGEGKQPGSVCALLSLDDECSECDPKTSFCVVEARLPSRRVRCECRPGFVASPGGTCHRAPGSNPCQDYSLHNCDAVAECSSETPGYFDCRCPKGFLDVSPDQRYPGRRCQKGAPPFPLSPYSKRDTTSDSEHEDAQLFFLHFKVVVPSP